MDTTKLPRLLDILPRAGAVIAISAYGVGFLIVSVRNAALGVTQFNLLRPQLFSAGILFGVFAVVPVVAVAGIWGLWGIEPLKTFQGEPWRTFQVPSLRPYRFAWAMLRVGVTYFACAYAAVSLSELSKDPMPKISARAILVLAVAWIVPGILTLISSIYYKSAPSLCLLLAFASTFSTGYAARHSGPGFMDRFLWLYIGALVLASVSAKFRAGKAAMSLINYWFAALFAVSMVAVFASVVYPDVKPEFGGGAPTSVVFQFEDKSPIDQSEREQAWLVEETDAGYYVLRAENDRKAAFIPRRLITAVYFGEASAPSGDTVVRGSRKGPPER